MVSGEFVVNGILTFFNILMKLNAILVISGAGYKDCISVSLVGNGTCDYLSPTPGEVKCDE
ncbi:MAG: hypothetical protein ACOX4P_00150 [Anaerovoracaceae bacterium]|jgi:hypothetical protein